MNRQTVLLQIRKKELLEGTNHRTQPQRRCGSRLIRVCGRAGRLVDSWLGLGEAFLCISARTSLLWPENRARLGHVLGMAAGFTHY